MKNKAKSIVVGTRLAPTIKDLLRKVAEVQGISESEYIRQLVLRELQRLSLISTKIEKIKQEVAENG